MQRAPGPRSDHDHKPATHTAAYSYRRPTCENFMQSSSEAEAHRVGGECTVGAPTVPRHEIRRRNGILTALECRSNDLRVDRQGTGEACPSLLTLRREAGCPRRGCPASR